MMPVIELNAVYKRWGQHTVLKGISLSVPRASVFAFLGNNGQGKSTTIRLLTGLSRADSGEIRLLNEPLPGNERRLLRQVGALIDSPCLYSNLTAREFLEIGCTLKQLPKSDISRVLGLVNLTDTGHRRVEQFSLGMRQRLALAHALLGEPRILILDEPGNGLDPQGQMEIRELISSLPGRTGATVFVSSHDLDEVARMATHLAVLNGGQIRFQGSMASLQASLLPTRRLTVGDALKAEHALTHWTAKKVVRSPQVLELYGIDGGAIPALHVCLIEAGVAVYESVQLQPTLEAWFLDITQTRQTATASHDCLSSAHADQDIAHV